MRNCIPANWKMSRLDSLLECVEAGSRPKGGVSHIKEGVPSVGGEHLAPNGSFRFEKLKFVPEEFAEQHDRGWIELGDILVVKDGATTGKTSFVSPEFPLSRAMINEHVLRLVASRKLSRKYLFYFLWSQQGQQEILKDFRGTAQGGISKGFPSKVEVPIAPEGEQHRIVEAIESYLTRLDAAVASLEQVQKNLERYRASVLKAAVEGRLVPTEAEFAKKEGRSYEPASELLKRILIERRKKWIENAAEKARAKTQDKARKTGKPWTNADDIKTLEKERAKAAKKYKEPVAPDTSNLPDLPGGWCWATIESLLREPLRNGHSAKATSDPDGIRTLTLTAVTEGDFSTQNTKITSADPQRVADLWLEPGDLLVERSNTVELVGSTALFDGSSRFAIFPDLMIRVRLLDGILPKWTESVLRSQPVRRHFQLTAQGIAGSMPKISQSVVATLPVPVPPCAEQQNIVDALDLYKLLVSQIAAESARAIARSRSLRQSILKWAFEGKLIPQDPNDEPASVLLERIKTERESMQPHKTRRSNKKKSEASKHDKQLDLLGGSNK